MNSNLIFRDSPGLPEQMKRSFYKSITHVSLNNRINDESDFAYFRQMHPLIILPVQKLVSETADSLEYHGSILHDEYPDKEQLYRIAADIYSALPDTLKKDAAYIGIEYIFSLLVTEFLHRRRIYRDGKD